MPTHRASTADLRAVHPFMPDGGPNVPGPIVGQTLSGQVFTFDPLGLYMQGLTTGFSMFIMGLVGARKSSQLKEMILRMLEWGRRFAIFDYKFEYRELAEFLGIPPLDFSKLVINPIDPERLKTPRERAEMLVLLIQIARGKREISLPDIEYKLLNLALAGATRRGVPTLRTIIEEMQDPGQEALDATRLSKEALFQEYRPLEATLSRFVGDGDLSGPFDGLTSPELDLTGQVTIFNFSTLNRTMRPLMINVIASWLDSAWIHDDKRFLFDFMIFEEVWEYFTELAFGQLARKQVKLQRQRAAAQIFVMHKPDDMFAAGNADSEQVALARSLIADCPIRVFYGQDESQRHWLKTLFGLNDNELHQVIHTLRPRANGPGIALWKFAQEALIVKQLASDIELGLVRTDETLRRKMADPDLPVGEHVPLPARPS